MMLYSCAEKLSQELRGLFGFHDFESCPNCRMVDEGFEGWGSNGHLQFHVNDRKQLTRVLRSMASKTWISTNTGDWMRYHFVKGHRIIYRGH